MPSRLLSRLRRAPAEPPEGDGVLVLRNGRPYDPAWDLWRPLRRWPGVILAAVVTAALLAAVAYHIEHHVHQAKPVVATSTHIPLRNSYFPPVSKDSTPVQSFHGTKSEFDVHFTSPGGLTSWTFQCKCQNNFDVTVYNSYGVLVSVPLNSIGWTYLAASANYPAGTYEMNIQAQGHWTINFITEAGLPELKTPFTYLSTGESVLGPFPASANTIETEYGAEIGQLATVQVVDKNDQVYDTPLFTIKSTPPNHVATYTNLPNPYYLIVSGSGLWLVKVS